jgi:hypothetical protein
VPTATDAELADLLARGSVNPVGRIVGSSNGALLCTVSGSDGECVAIYKPEATERPLWDYPDGTLTARERAAWLVSEAGGFGVVPPTVLRDGPLGPGSLQLWIGPVGTDTELLVDVTPRADVPAEWIVVLEGEDPAGEPVVVSHSPDPGLRTVAVLDAVLNNSDRKGGHVMRDPGLVVDAGLVGSAGPVGSVGVVGSRGPGGSGGVRGCDHGVSLGVEPKLRTVLWGWAGMPMTDDDIARLERLAAALEISPRGETEARPRNSREGGLRGGPRSELRTGPGNEPADGPIGGLGSELASLLTHAEVIALGERVAGLLRHRVHPIPRPGWPAIPWPAM